MSVEQHGLQGLMHLTIFVICFLLAILTAIETIAKNVDGKYSQSNVEKAKPPFVGTCQFQIIVIVVIVKKILLYTRGLTKKLQGIDRDLAKVMSDVKLLKETLKE